MKSILFYFTSIEPAGGIERVITTLANNFSGQYDVTILVKGPAISFYPINNNIKFFSLNNDLKLDMQSKVSRGINVIKSLFKSTKSLKNFLKNKSFDYYYIATPMNALEFHFAKGISKSNTIVTEHGAPNAYNSFYKFLKTWLYPKAKSYVIPTTSDTRYYLSLGMPAIYIPHFKSNLKYSKSDLNSKIALNVGRYTEHKRQWILIELWKKIVYTHDIKDWKLLLVGNGELEAQLVDLVKQLHLQQYVEILSQSNEIEKYYSQSSLFLLSSDSEGFGMVLLEAISFGLPCISYDCPSGPRDIIQDNVNGYLIKHNDVCSFEEKLLKVIMDKNLIDKFGSNSFELSTKWTDDIVMKEWLNILTR